MTRRGLGDETVHFPYMPPARSILYTLCWSVCPYESVTEKPCSWRSLLRNGAAPPPRALRRRAALRGRAGGGVQADGAALRAWGALSSLSLPLSLSVRVWSGPAPKCAQSEPVGQRALAPPAAPGRPPAGRAWGGKVLMSGKDCFILACNPWKLSIRMTPLIHLRP